MKRLDPLGRNVNDIDASANYGELRYGCACSASQQASARAGRYPGDCICQCSHGQENMVANYSIGYKK